VLRTHDVVSFCNFCLLFSLFCFFRSLSLSRVCSLRVHISLLWQHSRSNSLSGSLARSLAPSHTQNRQTERAKDTQQTDKLGSGEAEVEDFFITNVRCAAELLLSSGKRSKRRSKDEEEEHLLACLSVSCFPDVEVPTSFQLSCLCHSISFL
jgi:hypothetical protein